jgi:hypothetical protein
MSQNFVGLPYVTLYKILVEPLKYGYGERHVEED